MLTDDQGSADVKFRNPDSPFITDNIDALAAESVRLDNYYVHPTCTPTRAALMTGRYGVNVGLSIALLPGNIGGLGQQYPTMPEHLLEEGYETYLVGKWHLGQSQLKQHPKNRGFNHFYGLLGGGFNHYTKQCGCGRYDFWRDFEVEYDNITHSTDLLNAEALKIVTHHVSEPSSKPFFLYLAHPAPHDPLLAPARLQEKCAHIKNYRRRMNCAMVAGVDEGFGRLISVLRESGELENTIIVFSSDNGGVPYAGGLNYPFRGGKSTAYEGGVRAPGFIYAPKQLGKNYNFKGLFHVADFFPTFMAMINATQRIKKAEEIDGVNQLPSLASGGETTARKAIHIHRDPDRDSHTYRKGPWKVIVGHHFMPLILGRVYNETTSERLIEGGTWLDRITEKVMFVMSLVSPPQNTIFLQYILWTVMESFNVGGLSKMLIHNQTSTGLLKNPFPSQLDFWDEKHCSEYPTVSLFNLEDDPQETTNLASKYPDIVKSMLAEAEKTIKNAPPMFRGDMIYKDTPVGPDEGLFSRLRLRGSEHSRVVPFSPFLPDSYRPEMADPADFIPLTQQQRLDYIGMGSQLVIMFVVVPLIVARFVYRRMF